MKTITHRQKGGCVPVALSTATHFLVIKHFFKFPKNPILQHINFPPPRPPVAECVWRRCAGNLVLFILARYKPEGRGEKSFDRCDRSNME
jgi:hypothetical protein